MNPGKGLFLNTAGRRWEDAGKEVSWIDVTGPWERWECGNSQEAAHLGPDLCFLCGDRGLLNHVCIC